MTTTMQVFERLEDLRTQVGRELGVSRWLQVDQAQIDRFADATGDHQWIHVDPARAAQGPFGATIAHGYLTLSLLPAMLATAFTITDSPMALNYGLNRVRFPAPVPVGSRLRGRAALLAYEAIDGGAQLTLEVTVEREGHAKPACVAQLVVRRYVQRLLKEDA
jgi:acyl dehydratase